MAFLFTYRCMDCGYEILSDPRGYYWVESGIQYQFKCLRCEKIVTLSSDYLGAKGYYPRCPHCQYDLLSTWNPEEGHCSQCDGEMIIDPSKGVIRVD